MNGGHGTSPWYRGGTSEVPPSGGTATSQGPSYPSVTRLTIKGLGNPPRGDGLGLRVAELEDQMSGLIELLVEAGIVPPNAVEKEPRDA